MVHSDTSEQEVGATLNKFKIGSVLVVQKERPVGIITQRYYGKTRRGLFGSPGIDGERADDQSINNN